MSSRILIVDDDRATRDTLALDFAERGIETIGATSAAEALTQLEKGTVNVVLADIRMPDIDGLELCRRATALRPDVPVIMITAFGSMETAVEAMRAGAFDFVSKPIEFELVAAAVQRALKQSDLEQQVQRLDEQCRHAAGYGQMLGESAVMRETYTILQRLAETDIPVLITGESGTGKELAARALHQQSSRAGNPFVPVNCPALPESLLESELFGHAAGAYTGAKNPRKGLFLKADGGTLFLDEIGDIPLALQPKLLRVLEEQTIRPVGSDREISVDVRLVSATNHDLPAAVHQRVFREDLFYRINGVSVRMPPLRDRDTDILLLARHFLKTTADQWGKTIATLSRPAAQRLQSYPWPGNVRELQNAMRHAVALAQTTTLTLDDLPDPLRSPHPDETTAAADITTPVDQSLETLEQQHILRILADTNNNKTETARRLGLDRKTLYRKLKGIGTPP